MQAPIASMLNTFASSGYGQPTQFNTTWYMDSGTTHHFTPESVNLTEATTYTGDEQAIVGNGKHIATSNKHITICFAINKVCQFMHAPTSLHLQVVKCILRYLKSSITHGYSFHCSLDLSLLCYTDVDWASNPDDQKSTSCYHCFLGPNLIS